MITPERHESPDDQILKEYSLADSVRGKYAKRFARGTNLVLPDPESAGECSDTAVLISHAGDCPVEPHENKSLDLHKAVSAHEQAEATLRDLINVSADPAFERMLERIHANLQELRAAAATTSP